METNKTRSKVKILLLTLYKTSMNPNFYFENIESYLHVTGMLKKKYI